MVVTISPSLSLYKIVVLPAASSPTIKILISFFAKSRLNSFANVSPILFKAGKSQKISNLRNPSLHLLSAQTKAEKCRENPAEKIKRTTRSRESIDQQDNNSYLNKSFPRPEGVLLEEGGAAEISNSDNARLYIGQRLEVGERNRMRSRVDLTRCDLRIVPPLAF